MKNTNSYSLIDFKEQFGTGEASVAKLKSTLTEMKLTGDSLFKEFFSNNEASATVPAQFLAQIVLGATSNPLFRDFAPTTTVNAGESIWIRRASDNVDAQVVEEGAEALVDATDYEKSEFVFRKVMKRPLWSYEALADTPIDLIGINNQQMGAKVTQKEDQLGLADLYYWTSGARATSYDNSIAPDVSTYLGNLISAVTDLPGDSDGFYKADVVITDAAGYKALLTDTNLPSAAFWGGPTFIQTGELTNILGCRIYVRTLKKYSGDYQRPSEALVTDNVSTYVLDSRFALTVIDRVPLTIDSWNINERQLSSANIWERTVLGVLQPKAIRRLTARTT